MLLDEPKELLGMEDDEEIVREMELRINENLMCEQTWRQDEVRGMAECQGGRIQRFDPRWDLREGCHAWVVSAGGSCDRCRPVQER